MRATSSGRRTAKISDGFTGVDLKEEVEQFETGLVDLEQNINNINGVILKALSHGVDKEYECSFGAIVFIDNNLY